VFAAVAYATLGNTQFSNAAAKAVACFGLAHGILLFVNPAAWETLYNVPNRESFAMMCRRNVGNSLVSFSVLLTGFAWDLPQYQAVGLAWASAGIGLVLLLPEMKKHNCMLTRVVPWILLMAFCAVAFLVPAPAEQDLVAGDDPSKVIPGATGDDTKQE
jgi:hypothetical protein